MTFLKALSATLEWLVIAWLRHIKENLDRISGRGEPPK